MSIQKKIYFFFALFLLAIAPSQPQSKYEKKEGKNSFKNEHPSLILTQNSVLQIQSALGTIPIFDKSLMEVKEEVDAEMLIGIQVPIPKDYSGGYTHERHKRNFLIMQKAGLLYQILGDDTYALYVKEMLFAYAELYPKLPVHPQTRSYARGKIFWQCLNDANWLVYTSQAYDNVYNFLSKEERKVLETQLFRPLADFISLQNPQFFNRVHNHSTWGNVAVGMIALVMDDSELLERALYGIKDDKLSADLKDNDGGYIKKPGQKVGFFGNLDEPFSPDGYYTEGPYYQRYAMYPFLIFAQALENKKPELKVFEYKNGVLLKAVEALLNLTDADGDFFPINDAQKGMSYYSRELVTCVDIAYHYGKKNPELLDIAAKQDRVSLDGTGLSVALDLVAGKSKPFLKKSIELRDGQNGNEGGLAILRKDDLELVFKYAAQGLSHGHYDKLSFSLYHKGEEVIQDYGLARFVNIEQKGGGNYLKENKTWAKQSIAHNTLIVDEKSHFDGNYDIGSMHHSDKYLFDVSNENLQVVSAIERNAYSGTSFHRTFVLIKEQGLNPYILDIMKILSNDSHQYDMPYYFLGQLMQTNFEYSSPTSLTPLGTANGYEHLYEEGRATMIGNSAQFNWLHNNNFYTITSAMEDKDELILARIGANDPNFNLRRKPVLIQRKKPKKDALFVSILEPHGAYSAVSELAVDAYSNFKKVEIIVDTVDYTAVKLMKINGDAHIFILSNSNNEINKEHKLTINGKEKSWNGLFCYIT